MDMKYKIDKTLFPDITEEHVEKMLHALGLDYESPKKRNGKYFCYPYRNHYDAGGNDNDVWGFLKEKGLADTGSSGMYYVTNAGLGVLSRITGIQIWSPHARYEADVYFAVRRAFIDADVYVGYGCWLPMSMPQIAEVTRIPHHKVRKAIHKLVEEGYLKRGYYGGCDDSGTLHCAHGYFCTEKVKELPYYQKAYDREMKIINQN